MEKYFLEKLQNVIIYANKTEIINLKFIFGRYHYFEYYIQFFLSIQCCI
jgi:hypothetical protein